MWSLPSEASWSPDPFVSEESTDVITISVADVLGPSAPLMVNGLSLPCRAWYSTWHTVGSREMPMNEWMAG